MYIYSQGPVQIRNSIAYLAHSFLLDPFENEKFPMRCRYRTANTSTMMMVRPITTAMTAPTPNITVKWFCWDDVMSLSIMKNKELVYVKVRDI